MSEINRVVSTTVRERRIVQWRSGVWSLLQWPQLRRHHLQFCRISSQLDFLAERPNVDQGLFRTVELVNETSLFQYRTCCVMDCYVLSTVNDKPWCVSETVSVVRVLGTPQSLLAEISQLQTELSWLSQFRANLGQFSPGQATSRSPGKSQISSWTAQDSIPACFLSVIVSENKIGSENIVRTTTFVFYISFNN